MSACSRGIKHAGQVILRAHFATELTQNSNPMPGSILSLAKWQPKAGNRPLSGKKSRLILRQLSASDERRAETWRVYTESGFRLLHIETTFVPLTAATSFSFVLPTRLQDGWRIELTRPCGSYGQQEPVLSLILMFKGQEQGVVSAWGSAGCLVSSPVCC